MEDHKSKLPIPGNFFTGEDGDSQLLIVLSYDSHLELAVLTLPLDGDFGNITTSW